MLRAPQVQPGLSEQLAPLGQRATLATLAQREQRGQVAQLVPLQPLLAQQGPQAHRGLQAPQVRLLGLPAQQEQPAPLVQWALQGLQGHQEPLELRVLLEVPDPLVRPVHRAYRALQGQLVRRV